MVAASASLNPAQAMAPSRTVAPFIISAEVDSFFFFGSVLAVVAAWIASALFHVDGFYVLAAVAVVSNGPHLASTWTRVYFDKREWRARPIQVFVVPACIAGLVCYLTAQGQMGARILNSTLLYWATWHFLSQNWGLLRLYQKRSGEPDLSLPLRMERPLLYLSVLWCMLHRLKTGPRSLFGVEVLHVDLPWAVIHGLLAVVVVLACAYAFLRIREKAAWSGTAWVRAGFLAVAFAGFFVPFLLITADGTTAFAAAACWHGFQYLGIVRFYHRNAWKDGLDPDSLVMSWLSQPGYGRLFWYCALLLALAGVGFVFIYGLSMITRNGGWDIDTWGGVVWLSFTLSHYYLDGVIWKLRKDRNVAARLLVQPS